MSFANGLLMSELTSFHPLLSKRLCGSCICGKAKNDDRLLIFRRSEKVKCILLCKATLNICQKDATLNICQNEATLNICQKKATLNIARFPNKNTSKTFSGGTCILKNKKT